MRTAGVASRLGRGVAPVRGEGQHVTWRPGDHSQLLSGPRHASIVILVSVEDWTRHHGSVLRAKGGVDDVVGVVRGHHSVEAVEMTGREDSVVGGRGRVCHVPVVPLGLRGWRQYGAGVDVSGA